MVRCREVVCLVALASIAAARAEEIRLRVAPSNELQVGQDAVLVVRTEDQ